MKTLKNLLKPALILAVVMRCAYKYLIALGIVSLLIQLIVAVVLLVINGNQKLPHVYEIWLGSTILTLILAGILAIIANFKSIKEFIMDEMRCA